MNCRKVLLGAAALAPAAAGCAPAANGQAPAPFPIRRGVNLGNALEAPQEGDWGYRVERAHLATIAAAGFDGVRLPVRWDTHMDGAGRIDPAWMGRVQEVAGWAQSHDLKLQLDVHHYEALIEAGPRSAHRVRFLTLWRQIAEAFATALPGLIFEPLNEPQGAAWTGAALSDLQSETVAVIRESNAERLIVLGPGHWQNIDALRAWRPPTAENIAVSVHYYEPHAFTHQGAAWLGADAPVYEGAWGARADRAQIAAHIAAAARWGRTHGVATQLGEFGVNSAAPLVQRAAWTRCVREACEANGMGWCVWDFAGAFAVWREGTFIPEMAAALR